MTLTQCLQIALQHFNSRQYQQAEIVCRQVLAEYPRQPDAQHLLGIIANAVGDQTSAVEWIRRALASAPDRPDFLQNLGWILRQLNRFEEAIAVFGQLIALAPANAEAHAQLGTLYSTTSQLPLAVDSYRRAVELKPQYAQAWNNLGLALQRMHKSDEALEAYQQAMSLRPDLAETHTNIGNVLTDKGQFPEAIRTLQHAISLRPNYMLPHNSMGSILRKVDRLDEALAAYERCLALEPGFTPAHNNRGQVLMDLLRVPEAIAGFRHTLALDPNFAEVHWNYALILLLSGELEEGWREYEWRWRWEAFPDRVRALAHPRWDGSNPAGRTIFIPYEQGIGDTLQMVRYATLLAERGARVIVGCQTSVARLVRGVKGVSDVHTGDEPLPPFDLQAPMMSLPFLFSTTAKTIPCRIPYLHADAGQIAQWRERIQNDGATFRVGLTWAGSPTHSDDRGRSIPLATCAPLLRAADATFYSLQKGPAAEQIQSAQIGDGLRDLTADLDDFADTAALIANLDLVITVDTAVAHLAGAMGKPVWVLLPVRPDWRWLLSREESPWYPSVRLFRQKVRGDWAEVIERAGRAFSELHLEQRH